jgi:ribosome-binding protein aMBF1 (putative translation factor)
VELEPEVRAWLEDLATPHFRNRGVLHRSSGGAGPLLSEPYIRRLDGKLRELRFHLEREAMRITYWIAPDRRIVLLTVFRKTRMREPREVERARLALARCMAEQHTADDGDEG